jgi:hypothetical protein
VQEIGVDVNKKFPIMSYNEVTNEFFCNWCINNYPFSLDFDWIVAISLFSAGQTGLEFLGLPSKTKQKDVLFKHLRSRVHGLSSPNEGYKKGRQSSMTMDRFSRPVMSDVETIAGYLCLPYTLFRQEVPFGKHLFIYRVFVLYSSEEFRKRTRRLSKTSIRQTLRLISNHLRGFVDRMLDDVNYIGWELDDGSDCAHLSHLLLFAKFVWPPPSRAEPSNLPVLRSYDMKLEKPNKEITICVPCKREREPSAVRVML